MNLKKVRLRVDVFCPDSGLLLGSSISCPISDTASKAHGAMDLHDATPLQSCARGGRKVCMIAEFAFAKDVQPRFQLYDNEGRRLHEKEDAVLQQPNPSDVCVLKESIIFITPVQNHAEELYRKKYKIKLVAQRQSDGYVSKKKFDFKYFLEKTPKCQQKMSFEATTTLKTYQKIQSLKPKTSSGFDELSNKLIKKCALKLSEPITSLINKSFYENQFPEGLKINVLKPLYKADEKNLPSNWRPISMLSTISKILESSANDQIVKHFQTNQLESELQFGFKAGHSCVHLLMLTRHHIEMAKNEL